MKEAFGDLTKGERRLWLCSMGVITASFLLSPANDYLNLLASLIGVTALIFVAKGYVLGQILTVVFSLFYGVISFYFGYYGEMITYLGMTTPIAILSAIAWGKHPLGETPQVAVKKMTRGQVGIMFGLTVLVTGIFYFILKALDTTNLFFSTVSVATSFLASYLTFMRSSFYAVAYMANDVVLIVLWTMATMADPVYLPMILCFVMFFINDCYGFLSWRNMEAKQGLAAS